MIQHATDVTISVFRLSVSLWMVSCTEVEERSQLAEEFSPEVGSETWVTIGDEGFGNAVKTEDVVLEDRGKLDGAVAHFCRNDVDVFGQTIDKDTNGVMTLGGAGKSGHEVNGDGVPTGCRNGKRLKEAGRNERRWFVELAAVACADIRIDVGSHAWPPNVSRKDVHSRVLPLMTRKWRVVCVMEEAVAKIVVVRNA